MNNTPSQKVEIMAPCGSFTALEAAIAAGCNSVYFGVTQLNMRARSAHNFEIDDLEQIAQKCSAAGVRSYIALNTLLYEHDLTLMRQLIAAAKKAGISAVIVADMAALQYAREIDMPIQASTQLSISNYEAVKFYAQFADTIVLAREVDLKMMKTICQKIKEDDLRGPAGELIKIEVFVHGALCIAQSGRCQMSLLQNNTSAQRGACLQECRKKYRIIEEETQKEMTVDGGYILSPKDLCCLPFLDEVIATGVSILKIEGRGKSPQYVDTVVRVYREAADSIAADTFTSDKIDNWMEKLKSVYNRGFSEGYYLGKPLPDLTLTHSGNQTKTERIFAGQITHYFPKAGVAELNLQASSLKTGDKIVVMGPSTGVAYTTIASLRLEDQSVESAQNPTTVTFPITDKVRKHDKVYILKERTRETA